MPTIMQERHAWKLSSVDSGESILCNFIGQCTGDLGQNFKIQLGRSTVVQISILNIDHAVSL